MLAKPILYTLLMASALCGLASFSPHQSLFSSGFILPSGFGKTSPVSSSSLFRNPALSQMTAGFNPFDQFSKINIIKQLNTLGGVTEIPKITDKIIDIPKITDFTSLKPSTNVAASRLGITTPLQLNFTFPTQKFTQAGAIFQNTTSITPQLNLSNSTFNGFSNAYKAEMAYLIAGIKDLNTSDGRMLTDKVTMDLISIDNTLKLINMNKSREQQLKPLLQFQVKQFLTDLDMIQQHLSKQTGVVINGDSNLVVSKNGQIDGSNNALIGNSSLISGNNNTLVGNHSIISGQNNGMIGNNGITIGLNNSVNASNSYVFTSNDVVTKNNSLVVGNNTIDLQKLNSGGSYINNRIG